MTKTDIYWGLYHIHIFFLTLLRISVPHLELLFSINHYFIVCIFNYRTILHVNYGLEIYCYCLYLNNFFSNSKKREQKQQQQQRLSTYSFVRSLGVCDGLCWALYVFLMLSRALLCVLGHSCAFPCVLYESELASVGNY